MAFRPVQWFLTNRFVHLRSFLGASMREDVVPKGLRDRLDGRLRHAIRIARIRSAFFALLYISAIAAAGTTAAAVLGEVTGGVFFELVQRILAFALAIAGFLVLLGSIGIFLTTRMLNLLEADILVLGMEVVSRCAVAGDAALPSASWVRRKMDK